MSITTTKTGEILIVTIGYEQLDAFNVGQFKGETKPVLSGAGSTVFDLSALQFIDSSGLGAFLTCQRRMNAGGGELVLCAVQPTVKKILEMVRMTKIIKVFDTREEAIKGLQARDHGALGTKP